MKLNNLATRAITGSIYVLLIVFSIIIHPCFFYTVFAVFLLASLVEFYSIVSSDTIKPINYQGIIISLSMFIITALINSNLIDYKYLALLIPLIFFCFIIELFRNKTNPLQNIAITLLGIIYIAVPLSLMLIFTNFLNEKNIFNTGLVLGFFILIWTNDTFAYLVGIKWGKNRLFERVSPKKSWEGSIGGLVFSIFGSIILSYYFHELSTPEWIGMSIIIVIFGSLGDLVESLFKRSLNIKDSGNILPGHGGILDRLDAVLIAAPFVFFYLILIRFF